MQLLPSRRLRQGSTPFPEHQSMANLRRHTVDATKAVVDAAARHPLALRRREAMLTHCACF